MTIPFLLACLLSCTDGSGAGVAAKGHTDTAAPATVSVTLWVYTKTSGCWNRETLELSARYWASYEDGAEATCEDHELTYSTTDGRCFQVTSICEPTPDDDPLLSHGADAVAVCRAAAESAPLCE